jgi:hypothetical protein
MNQARTDDGVTPLHAAAYNGHLPIAQHLVVYGADTTATNHGGSTPSEYAANWARTDVAEWLDAVPGWNWLRVAAGCRHHAAITIQLKRGTMDPDALLFADIRLALAAHGSCCNVRTRAAVERCSPDVSAREKNDQVRHPGMGTIHPLVAPRACPGCRAHAAVGERTGCTGTPFAVVGAVLPQQLWAACRPRCGSESRASFCAAIGRCSRHIPKREEESKAERGLGLIQPETVCHHS